jgi:hypothetical protein
VQDQAEAEEEDIVVDEKTAETIHDALRNAARVFTHAEKALEDVQLLAYQYAEKVILCLGQQLIRLFLSPQGNLYFC